MMSKAHQDGVTVAFLVLSCFRVLADTCIFTVTILPINQPPKQPVGQGRAGQGEHHSVQKA